MSPPCQTSRRLFGRLPPLWLIMLALVPTAARAQWDGQLAWLSDERYRGASLSAARPAWQAALNADHGSGLYGGAMASVNATSSSPASRYRLYAGWAAPMSTQSALSWDAGVQAYRQTHGDAYAEPYIGLHGTNWHARLAHAPHYEDGLAASYVELEVAGRRWDAWHLDTHVGLLHLNGPRAPAGPAYEEDRDRLDAKLTVSGRRGRCRMALSLEGLASRHHAHGVGTLSLAWRF